MFAGGWTRADDFNPRDADLPPGDPSLTLRVAILPIRLARESHCQLFHISVKKLSPVWE
jgi:hypothetical protein